MNRKLFIKTLVNTTIFSFISNVFTKEETKYMLFLRNIKDIGKNQDWILKNKVPIKTIRYSSYPNEETEKEILHLIELWNPNKKPRTIIKINPNNSKEWRGRTRIRIIY